MKSLRPHQTKASQSILAAFNLADRTNITLPCGSGKSIIGVEIARTLTAAKRVVFFAPSLALIGQTMNTWKEEGILNQRNIMCICSDHSLSNTDEDSIDTLDFDIKVTTSPDQVHAFLAKETQPIVFCTYQSSDVLKTGMPNQFVFDLGIFDEAHRTASENQSGQFSIGLTNSNIAISKRLFMTATPKHYVLVEDADKPYSMDDIAIYGKRSYSMSIKEAVEQKLICDYQVMISITTDRDLQEALGDHSKQNKKEDRLIGAAISIKKALKATKAKKIFLFATSIKEALAFNNNKTVQKELDGIKLFHVSGKMSAETRKKILKEFEACECGIITNVRCLSEGVDSPAVDMVVFLSNKRSTIDIVQATGRAMRLSPGKTFGYVLLPLYVNIQNKKIEDVIQLSEMRTIFEVLSTMAEQEEMISVYNAKTIKDPLDRSNKWRNFTLIGHTLETHSLKEKIDVQFVKIMGLSEQEIIEKKQIAIKELENIKVPSDAIKLFAYWNKKQTQNIYPERFNILITALNEYYFEQKPFNFDALLKKYQEKAGPLYFNLFFNDYLNVPMVPSIELLKNVESLKTTLEKLRWLRQVQGDFCTYIGFDAPIGLRLFATYAAFLFEARKCNVPLSPMHHSVLNELSKLDLVIEMKQGLWISFYGFNPDIERWQINYKKERYGKYDISKEKMIHEISFFAKTYLDLEKNFKYEELTRLYHLVFSVNYTHLAGLLIENKIRFSGLENHQPSLIELHGAGKEKERLDAIHKMEEKYKLIPPRG
jgi:superfamily II DNA or RNA helicase